MLKIDADDKIKIEPFPWTAPRIAILGTSGYGKSNTAAVLAEELLNTGIQMTIVDIEGEMWGLKQRFDLLIAGNGDHADLTLGVNQAAALASWSWQNGLSVILDVSDFDKSDREAFLLVYFEALWKSANDSPKPYMVLLEEAHEHVPEIGRTLLKETLIRLALRGRKRGVGMVFVSQRSSKVSKDVLTQCGMFFSIRSRTQ